MLDAPGTVPAADVEDVASQRYADFDRRRRAQAEEAEALEMDDLLALTESETRRRGRGETSEPG